jgi:2-iminobutanoate/2-iminopropanoate deaminase
MPTAIFHLITGAPQPVAPYSHAVESDGWVFLTGQIPNNPEDDLTPLPDGVEAQTRRVLENLTLVLGDLGLGLGAVVCVRVFLTHFQQDYAAMNTVYASYFPPDRRPARTCIGVTDLAREARIEIDCIARRP